MHKVCFRATILQCKINEYYIFWACVYVCVHVCVCVCVYLCIQHAKRMRYIVIYGLPGSEIFFHIIP